MTRIVGHRGPEELLQCHRRRQQIAAAGMAFEELQTPISYLASRASQTISFTILEARFSGKVHLSKHCMRHQKWRPAALQSFPEPASPPSLPESRCGSQTQRGRTN